MVKPWIPKSVGVTSLDGVSLVFLVSEYDRHPAAARAVDCRQHDDQAIRAKGAHRDRHATVHRRRAAT